MHRKEIKVICRSRVTAFVISFILGIMSIIYTFFDIQAAPWYPGDKDVSVSYQTHVQNIGWQNEVQDGTMSGTEGRALRLEAIRIKVSGSSDLGVTYQTHVQHLGWGGAAQNGESSGTEGRSLRLEAISIRLTGTDADKYDIYYRVHSQDYGWLSWTKNGAYAGTSGQEKRLEGIEIKIAEAGKSAPGDASRPFIAGNPVLSYQVCSDWHWTRPVAEGGVAEVEGDGGNLYGINAICTNLSSPNSISIQMAYSHIKVVDTVYGTDKPYSTYDRMPNDALSYISSFSITLNEPGYVLYYRGYYQNSGWTEWKKNGENAAYASFPLHKVEMKLVKEGGEPPKN